MAVHLTPAEIAESMEVEPSVVLNAAQKLDVPVLGGRIDSVLFAEALIADGHHLADRARPFLPER